jgi:hypothetical protein
MLFVVHLLLVSLYVLNNVYACQLVAMHQTVITNNEDDSGITIRLRGANPCGNKLTYVITELPAYGAIYQLSQIYNLHGYNPISGKQITEKNTVVDWSSNRIYYVATSRRSGRLLADAFSFMITDGKNKSFDGTLTIVDKSGAIVGSDFLTGDEGWTIIGNAKAGAGAGAVSAPKFQPFNRGESFNYYIYAKDEIINHSKFGEQDKSLWYFNAPAKFLGNKGAAYGGHISFSIGLFAGDIASLSKGVNLVELECKQCGYNTGITLAHRFSKIHFKNAIAHFKIELVETANWLKDPRDSLKHWSAPSKCEFIQVLSRLSGIRILGDITTWYETVAIDNVFLSNTKNIVPLCAMGRSDASVCTCE